MTTIELLTKTFSKSINLLIIDDCHEHTEMLYETLKHPLIRIHLANSFQKAIEIIPSVKPWHFWIVDINLKASRTGLDIIHANKFPWALVLSAVNSLEVGIKAGRIGVIDAIEKAQVINTDRVIDYIIRYVPLSVILKGEQIPAPLFNTLINTQTIINVETWSRLTEIHQRNLHRYCQTFTSMSPKNFLTLYYGLQALLLQDHIYNIAPYKSFNYQNFLHIIRDNLEEYTADIKRGRNITS